MPEKRFAEDCIQLIIHGRRISFAERTASSDLESQETILGRTTSAKPSRCHCRQRSERQSAHPGHEDALDPMEFSKRCLTESASTSKRMPVVLADAGAKKWAT